ncbi:MULTISPECIES: mammalian cell entry protein [unclassified Mycobacterium]|uniref:mammalian cell entry protein n=1 Tax=unclassified Mycobacterium TaxID=2642494 RepID=UPI000801CF4A|nr:MULTISPECIES: mammalian cell entry protein [unclassified Mycobacterium]OBG48641.1 mammalian cell entry protein [Mycobacterium sp. E735]OBG62758.1 mammalian cell entry protein [Mycobacterium sp. E188]OBG74015.1 mammalian cell entry protein [Mycobacterium sp. E3305]OBH33019.1 mammalian cell entry protein [Mycobacterium sp. E1715]OBH42019.1 mammalian cell entry protein [Mycobacterium sp. E183]
MEDQQPAAGDLTADGNAATSDEAATEEREESGSADETASAAEESEAAEGDTEAAEAAEDQPPARKRRKLLAGKRLAVTVAVAAALFVGSAAFAGATVQPYLSDRAAAATKLKVARTAANAITTLWTYTPENMDTLADRASGYLSGDFEAQYRKFVDAIVAPNKQAKITNHTDVTGAAVESIDDANAVVIVYTNTTSTSPLTKNVPSLKYLSYRLFLKRAQSRWLVTRMTTITSLDLTPHV